MRASVINNNFTAGELTPLMYGRSELEPYQKGLATCKNMRVLKHGGATRRDGTRYMGEVKDSSKAVRLVPFVYSDDDALMIEMGDQYMRFWDQSGLVLGSTEEVTNGTFDTDIASWTDDSTSPGAVVWDATYSALRLNASGAGVGAVYQAITGLTIGHEYRLNVDMIIGVSASSRHLRVGNSIGGIDYVNAKPIAGTNVYTFTVTATTIYIRFALSSIAGYVIYDNISLKDTDSSTILEIATPYLESELFEVMYAQSNDVMWFTHRSHAPQKVVRESATSITIGAAPIAQAPFAPFNTSATTQLRITGGAYSIGASVTLLATSATSPNFNAADDIGKYYVIHNDADLTQWVIVRVTAVASTVSSTATIIATHDGAAVVAALQATDMTTWSGQKPGVDAGWPAAVTFQDQRLLYGGTPTYQQDIWGSTVGDFDLFSYGVADDDHIDYTLSSTKQGAIAFLANKYDLVAGTISNEWALRGGGLEDPLTPGNVVAKPHTSHGAKRRMPEETDDLLVFIQRAGHKVIGLSYDPNSRALASSDLTILSEHLTSTTQVQQIGYQEERDSVLWCVLDNGSLVGMTYDPDQSILGWHNHDTAVGVFESVAVIPHVDADQAWVLVNRLIDGSVVRYIERMEDKDWRVDNDPYYVDCGISYNGVATYSITGLDHLEGEDVQVYAEGENLGEYTVSSGAITLDKAVTQAHVGLGYTSRIKELPDPVNTPDGSGHSRQKHKPIVDLRLYKTQGIRVNGDIKNLPRDASVTKPELFSGIINTNKLGWDDNAQNEIESIGPNPLSVLAIRSTISVGQR